MRELLVVKDLAFRYPSQKKPVFHDISFSLNEGELLGITGLSGCGKSTLCLCLAGIIPHHLQGDLSGTITYCGQSLTEFSLPQLATLIGLVFQDPETMLFCSSVEEELAFGPENLCLDPDIVDKQVEKALAEVGLTRYRSQNPGNLSGGEQHLVALAAILALEPRIIIMDEVLSQLDEQKRRLVFNVIGNQQQKRRAVILVDHNSEHFHDASQIISLTPGADQCGHNRP